MKKRTYLDTGVLIAAFKGEEDISRKAFEIIDNPNRILVISEAVLLELMPKPIYNKQYEEVQFY